MGAASEPAPDSYHSRAGHQSKFSTKLAYWGFSMVNEFQDSKWSIINPDVIQMAHKLEKAGAEAAASWDAEADKLDDESAAVELLTQRSNAFVEQSVGEWWEFAFSLFAKFSRYVTTQDESVGGETLQRYPEWWLRSPEVGFTSWRPEGPIHGIVLMRHMTKFQRSWRCCRSSCSLRRSRTRAVSLDGAS